MRLSDQLDPERVRVPLRGASKEEILRELVQLALPDLIKPEEILAALYRREAIQSTGIGHAVAIPHCIAQIGGELAMAAGVHPAGVDFGSSDQTPARIFFLVISSPRGRSQHLRMLTCISSLLGKEECRHRLMACPDGPSLLKTIQEAEED